MRKKLIYWLFEISKKAYTKWFKKDHIAWEVTTKELQQYPAESFGYQLGHFLAKNHFELLPKVERHDAYHTLTGFGTSVEEEIALQYLCMGNGKKSPYMYGAVLLGTFILPEYLPFYLKAYQKGKAAHRFHHFDFQKLLPINFDDFKSSIFCTPKTVVQPHLIIHKN